MRGILGNPIVRRGELIEKLQAEAGSFAFVPLIRCRDVEIGKPPGNQPILSHRGCLARSLITSWAGRTLLGSRRYSARRSLTSLKCDVGTGKLLWAFGNPIPKLLQVADLVGL